MKHNFLNILINSALLVTASQLTFAQTAPNLGPAAKFALYTSVGGFANTGTTTITGDIGNGAGAVTGSAVTVTGQTHFGDNEGVLAATGVATAYAFLASESENPCENTLTSPLGGGTTLTEGVHCIGTATALTGTLILDAENDPNAIFIIKINGALSADATASILLANGAQIKNVYWQVNGAFTVAAGVAFVGTVINAGAISFESGASLSGRALSTAGQITLNNNTISNAEVSLPVTLVSFTVKKGEHANAELQWSTTSEVNSDYFEVQHSQLGKTWTKLAVVKSHGESTQFISYSFSDLSVRSGNNLYRLKMMDKDGTFAYSRIRSLNMEAGNRIVLYPNPAINNLTLLNADAEHIRGVQFFNTAGKLVLDRAHSEVADNTSEFNINHLPNGLYIIKVSFANGTTENARIIKR
ncbi:ice-binding family protein [Dyadobacter crusticola]|uniref:ice-binding family protein n=1 Tax=Dyadobacter crusticola TaxID=292407 RepID=UPI000689CB9A|nr:ice-binding family protein [Dyadobacter crusticola]